MKDINDLTIKEYKDFVNLFENTKSEDLDIFAIFEIFGEDAKELKFDDFEKKWKRIQNMTLSTHGVKKIYKIGDRRFKACLNATKLKAGQYIDFQNYMQNKNGFEIENILSVFLLPQKKSWLFGKYKTLKYNDNYDIDELKDFLLNNMRIGEASELNTFFLRSSTRLMKLFQGFFQRKILKNQKKKLKEMTH